MEKNKTKDTRLKMVDGARAREIGSDEMTAEIEKMIREMPYAKPPAQLLSAVMQAVRTEKISPWVRFYRWATSPRFTPFRMAAATALSAVLVFSVLVLQERGFHNIVPGGSGELIPVEFALNMPEAHSVHVVGSFNNWVPQPCELRQDNGSPQWKCTLKLQPGRYEYAFLVDGKHMPHPRAAVYKDDGFGNQNSVLALGKEDDI